MPPGVPHKRLKQARTQQEEKNDQSSWVVKVRLMEEEEREERGEEGREEIDSLMDDICI